MFINTLGISDKWITTISKKIYSHEVTCVDLYDKRGNHATRPNKILDEIKDSLRAHIISEISLVDSHYVWARSNKK